MDSSYKKSIENRQMSQDLMKRFIEMYKAHPNLWKTTSEDYRNKVSKEKSYNALVKLISTEIPNADKNFVVKKINTLRVCFRKEYRKWLENNEYKPLLWYYNLISFIVNENSDIQNNYINDEDSFTCNSNIRLTNHDISFKSGKNDFKITNDIKKIKGENIGFESIKESFSEDAIDSNDETFEYDNENYFITNQNTKHKSLEIKRVSDSDSDFFVSQPNFQEVTQLNLDEFETFGFFVSKKLKNIASKNHEQYVYCENIINQAIMKAQLGKLKENSSIYC